MNRTEKRRFLIRRLLDEQPRYLTALKRSTSLQRHIFCSEEPFEEEKYESAIVEIRDAEKNYDPECSGYNEMITSLDF